MRRVGGLIGACGGGGDGGAVVPQFGEEETRKMKALLRFRFEVQVVQNHVLELSKKAKYRRTAEMIALGAADDEAADVGGEDSESSDDDD